MPISDRTTIPLDNSPQSVRARVEALEKVMEGLIAIFDMPRLRASHAR